MSFQNPSDVFHILMTTNTSAIAAVLTSTITSWIVMKKPDLGMTVNGCLAGLVGVTGGCAYVSIEASLLIGALAGILVVFAVRFFDNRKIDDPVGATSVHLGCGIFGTLCVGLFAQEGVTSLSTTNGLFYGGGFRLLGIQLLGTIVIGAFTFVSSGLVWLVLKKTIGIRVSREEEIQGLDIGEHGNIAYPDFAPVTESIEPNDVPAVRLPAPVQPAVGVEVEKAVPVEHHETNGARIAKVTILTNQNKFSRLQESLDKLGITGITVTNVLGYGTRRATLSTSEELRFPPACCRKSRSISLSAVFRSRPWSRPFRRRCIPEISATAKSLFMMSRMSSESAPANEAMTPCRTKKQGRTERLFASDTA